MSIPNPILTLLDKHQRYSSISMPNTVLTFADKHQQHNPPNLPRVYDFFYELRKLHEEDKAELMRMVMDEGFADRVDAAAEDIAHHNEEFHWVPRGA